MVAAGLPGLTKALTPTISVMSVLDMSTSGGVEDDVI